MNENYEILVFHGSERGFLFDRDFCGVGYCEFRVCGRLLWAYEVHFGLIIYHELKEMVMLGSRMMPESKRKER